MELFSGVQKMFERKNASAKTQAPRPFQGEC